MLCYHQSMAAIIQRRRHPMQCTISFNSKIALLLLHLTISFNAQSAEWIIEKSSAQVEVKSRQIVNNGITLADKEISAKTVVNTSLLSLLRLLDDTTQASSWIEKCIEVKLIEGTASHTKLVQTTFSAPWPMQNRDMVTKSITHIEDNTISIDVYDAGQQLPKQKNTVRMTNIRGTWTAIKLSDGLTEIHYQGSGNASGNVPMWLANKVLIDSTYATFLQLSEVITQDKYQVP